MTAGWVNGGFFVLEPDVLDYIAGDETVWEREPLERLAEEGRLGAYRHDGYWQNTDSLRDKMVLKEQWASGWPRTSPVHQKTTRPPPLRHTTRARVRRRG